MHRTTRRGNDERYQSERRSQPVASGERGTSGEQEQAETSGLWGRSLRPVVIRYRNFLEASFDAGSWAIALYLALVLRFEFAWRTRDWGPFDLSDFLEAAVIAGLLQLVLGFAAGLYRQRFNYGSFEEVARLAGTAAATTIGLAVLNNWAFDQLIPTSVTFISGLIAVFLMAAVRYLWRLNLERNMRPSPETSQRVIVFGAGEGGAQLVTAMLRNPDSPFLPVAILDDDPARSRLRLRGIPVQGGRDQLRRVAEDRRAEMLVIAIPSAGRAVIGELTSIAIEIGLEVRVLPPITDLLHGSVGVADVRPLTEADLLGRHEIDTDVDAISGYLTGRRVLVTGAGGSIGSELCHQISRFGPSELVMIDRDESALHSTQLLLEGRALLESRNLLVCDLRDREALARAFLEHRPEVVFHAAALKHLPLLEMHPTEAVKTNILGTQNMLDLAAGHDIGHFVNISTDKAADPTSVLGYTKRIAERLTAATAQQTTGTFLSVRFGNVLGSRGSVLTAFERQVADGGPITVTHRDVTRFFMTVEEAVQLVIQAGAVGRDAEALVLDMGDPVKIDDIAQRLAAQSDRPIEIVYTGLRPGEKMHEVLFSTTEKGRRPVHPLISHVAVPPLTIVDVQEGLVGRTTDEEVIAALQVITGAPPSTTSETTASR